jgi:hypothetical protein
VGVKLKKYFDGNLIESTNKTDKYVEYVFKQVVSEIKLITKKTAFTKTKTKLVGMQVPGIIYLYIRRMTTIIFLISQTTFLIEEEIGTIMNLTTEMIKSFMNILETNMVLQKNYCHNYRKN